ncbi:MAG: 4-hydroxythreonine-4-phosphate dehydrogenase PdxA [Pseudomonadota bacterium]
MSEQLAITMGDPAGIGPEIVLKVMAMPDLPVRPLVIGDAAILRDTAVRLGLKLRVTQASGPGSAASTPGHVAVFEPGAPFKSTPPPGVVSAAAGQAAYDYIRSAISLAKEGQLGGIVTAPINKEALAAAGVPYPGHTEMLADLGGAPEVAMMLANAELRVVLVTIHCSLRDAIDRIDRQAVLRAIRLAHEGTRAFGVAAPRVAVAGLNPHAGEGGLFGREEIEIIAPAIDAARAEGIDASGPWPGDTVFMQARGERGRFDVVVAQYHDQGLIPVKYLGIEDGVNITLGLPFVRTSPDHGTAFDIAGQGIADPRSLHQAVLQAAQLVAVRQSVGEGGRAQ